MSKFMDLGSSIFSLLESDRMSEICVLVQHISVRPYSVSELLLTGQCRRTSLLQKVQRLLGNEKIPALPLLLS
jgi:hypothetical protein